MLIDYIRMNQFYQYLSVCRVAKRPAMLTFQHWSGLGSYTSSYEFEQEPVFLINSRQEIFSCDPKNTLRYLGWVLLRTYDRFFAEFLQELSPVHLGLLDLPTCVGLRYGSIQISFLKLFLEECSPGFPFPKKEVFTRLEFPLSGPTKIQ